MIRTYIAILLFLTSNILIGQNSYENDLIKESFDSIKARFNLNYKVGEYQQAKEFADLYLEKARNEKPNSIEHIYGHVYNIWISDNLEDESARLDSVIRISNSLEDNYKYPALAYFWKGNIFYEKKLFNEALNLYLTGLKYSEENNNHYQISLFNNMLGLIKAERIGKEREAQELYNQSLSYYDTIKNMGTKSYDYLLLLFAISENYRKLNLIDSSSYFNNKGLLDSKKYDVEELSQYFVFAEGINDYLRGNNNEALSKLEESYNKMDFEEDMPNEIIINYYLGKIYSELGQKEKGLKHYLKMDSLQDIAKIYSFEIRDGLEDLIDYYKLTDNIEGELSQIKKLRILDSIYINDYKAIINTINTRYDDQILIDEQLSLIEKLKTSKTNNTKLILVSIFIGICLILVYVYFTIKQRSMKRKFDLLVSENSVRRKQPIADNKNIGISKEIVDNILEELKLFEENEQYLKHGITVRNLAKNLKTNDKYLSKTIKHFYDKKFVDYINDLRIDYAIEKLKTDKKFKLYNIKIIADEVGFSNQTSFSQAFEKRHDLKPSYFIKQLKNT